MEVSPQCPVEATVLGYYPVISGNVILLVVFSICFFAQIFLGIKSRLPAFASVVTIGCMGEAIGYGGRRTSITIPRYADDDELTICQYC
jgi:hypothetical protein